MKVIKEGLDYFSLDCRMDTKMELIEAEYGLTGFAVVIKLFQLIFGEHGYYINWTNDVALMFSKRNQVELDNVTSIIQSAIQRGIFDKNIFETFNALTSAGIQKRYFQTVSRRKNIQVIDKYLLVKVGDFCEYANILHVNDNISTKNDNIEQQSKEKKSKEKNINTFSSNDNALELFEYLWSLYPLKRGKSSVSITQKRKIFSVGKEEMERCISRYKKEIEDMGWKQYKNGSTFFNSGYVDYLDKNYQPVPVPAGKSGNKFNHFEQRTYSTEESSSMEKNLLQRRK